MSHGRVKILNDGQLEHELTSAGKHLVVVDFTAIWCGPCKMIAPVFESLSNDHKDVIFLKVDVDQCKETTRACGVSAMPTFHFYLEKKLVSQFSGANQSQLKSTIEKFKPQISFTTAGNALGGGNSSGGLAARLEALETKNNNLSQQYIQQMGSPTPTTLPTLSLGTKANNSSFNEEPNPIMLKDLLDMGFPENRCKKALIVVKNSSTEDAMNWIFEHMEDPIVEDEKPSTTSNTTTSTQPMQVDTNTTTSTTSNNNPNDPPTVHNARCDICTQQIIGIRFKCSVCPNYDLCQNCYDTAPHCTHEYKPHDKDIENYQMTPEERELARKKLDEKIQIIRKQKKEEEDKKEIEREISRRTSGKTNQESIQKWKDDQIKREAEKLRKEKEADKIAKEKIRAKLAQDKLERQAKKAGEPINTTTTTTTVTPTPPVITTPTATKTYTESTIQIKLLDGSTIKGVFSVTAPLQEVYTFVQNNSKQGTSFNLTNTYPRKTYTKDELKTITISDAGLIPNGTFVCTK